MTPDDALTRKLREAADDPPPESLLAAARAAYSWRTVEGELTPAGYDSLLDEGLTSVRSGGDARLLSFGDDTVALDLEVTSSGALRTLLGQLTPAVAARVTIRHGGAHEVTVSTDVLGRFHRGDLLPGALSLRCEFEGQATLHTDWVLV